MARRKIPMSERQHGVPATYKAGCRCDDCTKAASAYAKERYEARKAGDVRRPEGQRKHGGRGTYNAGCRCEACTEAQSAYNRKRREAAKAAELSPAPVAELRIPVSCVNCGGPLARQAEGRPTESGTRVSIVMRCTDKKCARQWLVTTIMQSLSGHEFMGAA